MPGPLLGLRDKMKESHPDAYSSFKTGQQKAEVLPGNIGVAGRQACVSAESQRMQKKRIHPEVRR